MTVPSSELHSNDTASIVIPKWSFAGAFCTTLKTYPVIWSSWSSAANMVIVFLSVRISGLHASGGIYSLPRFMPKVLLIIYSTSAMLSSTVEKSTNSTCWTYVNRSDHASSASTFTFKTPHGESWFAPVITVLTILKTIICMYSI